MNKALLSAELSHPRARESPEPSKGWLGGTLHLAKKAEAERFVVLPQTTQRKRHFVY